MKTIKKIVPAVRRFMKSLVQTDDYIKSNPGKAKEFVKNKFGYDSKYIDYIWLRHQFIVVLPQPILVAFEHQARWRIKHRLTNATKIPNYLNFIYMDALEEVKPEAVTIIR